MEDVIRLSEPDDLLARQHAVENVEEDLHHGVEVAENRGAQVGVAAVEVPEEDEDRECERISEVGDDLRVEVGGGCAPRIGDGLHLVVVVGQEEAVDEKNDLADDAASDEDEEAFRLLAVLHRDLGGANCFHELPVQGADRLQVFAVDDPRRRVLWIVGGEILFVRFFAIEEDSPVAEAVHVNELYEHALGGGEVDDDTIVRRIFSLHTGGL